MTRDPTQDKSAQAREARLAQALRSNLRRRKSEAPARPLPPEEGAAQPVSPPQTHDRD